MKKYFPENYLISTQENKNILLSKASLKEAYYSGKILEARATVCAFRCFCLWLAFSISSGVGVFFDALPPGGGFAPEWYSSTIFPSGVFHHFFMCPISSRAPKFNVLIEMKKRDKIPVFPCVFAPRLI